MRITDRIFTLTRIRIRTRGHIKPKNSFFSLFQVSFATTAPKTKQRTFTLELHQVPVPVPYTVPSFHLLDLFLEEAPGPLLLGGLHGLAPLLLPLPALLLVQLLQLQLRDQHSRVVGAEIKIKLKERGRVKSGEWKSRVENPPVILRGEICRFIRVKIREI